MPRERPPSRYLRPEDLKRLHGFQFAARVIVEGFYTGKHRSPSHDTAGEFADYRPYVIGDDPRALDWRAYARTDREFVRLYRKETDMRCHLLLDTSRSMAFHGEEKDGPPLTKFEYGAYLAAALSYLIIRQGDKVSLALGAEKIEAYSPPGGAFAHLHRLTHQLEQHTPQGETHLAAVLKALFALSQRRGMLIVLSDFLEEAQPLFDALAHYVGRGWQLLLIQILTEDELELTGDTLQRYQDAEGTGHLIADPDALRDAYRAEVQHWLTSLEAQATARRIHYVRMTTSTPYEVALERYLSSRSR